MPALCRQPVGISNGAQAPGVGAARFRLNRDGTIFSGLADPGSSNSGAYKFNGPVYGENGASGDLDGAFQGLPVFVRMPNGGIKENVMYSWASTPLERIAGFGSGHYEITDNIRLTGQFSVARTKTESSLGLASANINQWGAGVPFGNRIYRRQHEHLFRHPGLAVHGGRPRLQRRWSDELGVHAERPIPCRLRRGADPAKAVARRPTRLHEVGGLAHFTASLQPDDDPVGVQQRHRGGSG